jgi:hypothetical protein
MFKKLIAISIAALVIGLFSTVALAGVEGSFDFDISLCPWYAEYEHEDFLIDFEGWLILDVTLSGLTFSNDLVFGVAGIEHYIADLETTLGALTLKDEFWFAAPYSEWDWGHCDNYYAEGPLQFVKKRVTAEITLAGLTLTNNIVWEDVMFDHPYTLVNVGSVQTPVLSIVDPVYRFGIGMSLAGETVSGIGVEAITGISYDPQLTNEVKKYSADGAYDGKDHTFDDWTPGEFTDDVMAEDDTVLIDFTWNHDDDHGPIIPGTVGISMTCTADAECTGCPDVELVEDTDYSLTVDWVHDLLDPTAQVTFTALRDMTDVHCYDFEITYDSAPQFPEFSVEKINITGISVAGVTIDNSIEFRPSKPISSTVDASFSLLNFLDIVISMKYTNILALTMSSADYTLATDLVTLVISDKDGDLAMTDGDELNLTASLPIQFLTLDVDLTSVVGTGLKELDLLATLALNSTTFSADAVWKGDGTSLNFYTITYTLATTVDHLRFDADATFSTTALKSAGIGVGVDFVI